MIGNDVVDLCDPEAQAGAPHARFDARVFAPSERRLLSSSAAPSRLRWRLWAAKEAAYKVARQLDATTVFAPSRFVVDPQAELVRCADRCFAVRTAEGESYVHVVAHPAGDEVDEAIVCDVAHCEGGDATASQAARALVLDALAETLPADRADLAIVTCDRIPRVEIGGALAPIDLSLSHHGRFVAYAFAVRGAA